jgi:hypothetical protein
MQGLTLSAADTRFLETGIVLDQYRIAELENEVEFLKAVRSAQAVAIRKYVLLIDTMKKTRAEEVERHIAKVNSYIKQLSSPRSV